MRNTAGLYIHIPFCKVKCHYCDFYSVADQEHLVEQLVDAVAQEIAQSDADAFLYAIDTVFIGGGTPSLLAPEHIERMLLAVADKYDLSGVSEFTMEANPGEITGPQMVALRGLGINRLSMGFQSFDAGLLKFLGRLHSPEDSERAFAAARKAGFENINVDMIYNVPEQSMEVWQRDLQRLVDLAPEHISAYSLTVESGTELEQMVQTGGVTMPDVELDRSMLLWTRSFLESSGYSAYEVSNHARSGSQCRHNLHYWRIEPYLGFGPSAHQYNGRERSWNIRHLPGYIENLERGETVVAGSERLSQSQVYHEKLIFGLRLAEGVSITQALGFSGSVEFVAHYGPVLRRWEGRLEIDGERLRLTGAGVLLADAISTDLMVSLPGHVQAQEAASTAEA